MAYKSNAAPPLSNCVHHGISRLQAEKLLLAAKQDGTFLLRESESVVGAFTLCLLVEGRVHQYRICADSDGMLSVEREAGVQCRKFSDLTELVQLYMHRGQKNGLAGPLLYPLMVEDVEDEIDDEGERIEEADSAYSQYEIIPPSEDTQSLSSETLDGGPTAFDDFVSRHFLLRFSHLNLSGCDGHFIKRLKDYIENDAANDAAIAAADGTDMKFLKLLLDEAVRELDRHVDVLMVKIDTCRQLFGPITTAPLIKTDQNTVDKADMQDICERVTRCKAAIKNLERKAELKFRDLSSMWKTGGVQTEELSPPRGQPVKPIIPPVSFEAKLQGLSQAKRIKLTVDIQAGKLLAIKPNKDVMNDSNVFTHDKIEQLVKSTSNNCRLDIKIAGIKKKTYIFDDVRQRENFCQMVQQLKNMYSINAEIRQLSIFVGTWNMANEVPNYNLVPWLKSDGLGKKRNAALSMLPHDIYVIGTQESCLSEKDWSNKLRTLLYDSFGEEFFQVSSASLWALRIIVLARVRHRNKFSHVFQSTVKTGIANTLGNKGAAAVSFSFDGTSFCFICCHLTSGHEKLQRRHQNARDILKGINLGSKIPGFYDASNQFHHVFMFGDLNYRLDELDSVDIIRRVKESTSYAGLLEFDQLKKAQNKKEAFVGFYEEEITFPPTYRFQKQTRDRYVWEKVKATGKRINAPSWCDRILWRSFPGASIDNTSYGSVDSICSSDHKPVFSSFDVGIINQFTSSDGGSALSGELKIVFEEISAEVKTTKQGNFQIHFYSTCLESVVVTKPNVQFASRRGYTCPVWTAAQLVQLRPILDDWGYLEDQYLLLAVKTVDDLESYGECALPLKAALSLQPQHFHAVLTLMGEETGSIRGTINLKASDDARSVITRIRSRRVHAELIYMDTDLLDIASNNAIPADMIYVERPITLPPPVDFEKRRLSRPEVLGRQNSSPSTHSLYSSAQRAVVPVSNTINRLSGSPTNNFSASKPPENGRDNLRSTIFTENKPHAYVADMAPAVPPRKNRGAGDRVPDSLEYQDIRGLAPQPPLPKIRSLVPDSNIFSGDNKAAAAKDAIHSSDPSNNNNLPAEIKSGAAVGMTADDSDDECESYTPIRIPSSIREWLTDLKLPQYVDMFIEAGWDHVRFVSTMTSEDLTEIGVSNNDHQQRILHSISVLNKLS